MQHYQCPNCSADAYSSASSALVKCPRCSESLEGAAPVPAAKTEPPRPVVHS
jgi:ribosomal protein L37AE/L43A